jgi:hypothetical protein
MKVRNRRRRKRGKAHWEPALQDADVTDSTGRMRATVRGIWNYFVHRLSKIWATTQKQWINVGTLRSNERIGDTRELKWENLDFVFHLLSSSDLQTGCFLVPPHPFLADICSSRRKKGEENTAGDKEFFLWFDFLAAPWGQRGKQARHWFC